jgi:hypothetical protein
MPVLGLGKLLLFNGDCRESCRVVPVIRHDADESAGGADTSSAYAPFSSKSRRSESVLKLERKLRQRPP